MYARGMTTREIQGHLEEIYGIEVSPTLISNVTDAVIEEVKLWQSRPLEELYPIVYLDALMVKVRDEGHIQNKAIYVVLGVNLEGQKEVLGLWVAQTEGAKFWLQVLTELQNRGVKDIFIACVDGLKGFPEAIEAVYPRTEVQLCIVHLVRASLNYVPWKLRKPVAADLQSIYRAATAAEAEQHLAELESKWKAYPSVSQVWRRNWARITPFFHYPPDIRAPIYTTNSVESLNRSLRKIIKTRGGFPNQEAALKLLFLALAAGGEEVDDADSSLAGSVKPLHHSVAGTDAGPGEGGVMKSQNPSTSLGEGRGNCPLPSRTHPQKLNLVVYTEELTHLETTDSRIALQERSFRWLARENRTRRRLLSKSLLEIMHKTPPDFRCSRVLLPSRPGEPHYLFLLLPRGLQIEEHVYRTVRTTLLRELLMVVKLQYPDAQHVIGIATETFDGKDYRSEDFLHLDATEWSEELNEQARTSQKELGLLVNVQKFVGNEKEYPVTDKHEGCPPVPRNSACTCGSGKRYKRCCGGAKPGAPGSRPEVGR